MANLSPTASPGLTLRPISPGAEKWLGRSIQVLDHGSVALVDYMGNDQAPVLAARVSNGAGTRPVNDDRDLVRYLMRHHHSTPFEMCELKLYMRLPIFVAREWIRHRTANVNEISARYSILDAEFYVPDPSVIGTKPVVNKQGRGHPVSADEAAYVIDILRRDATTNYGHYRDMMAGNEDAGRDGIARELARMNLTLNTYTSWYWKSDFHNIGHLLRLRLDQNAMYEARCYAQAIYDIVRDWMPVCTEALDEYRLHAASLSRTMVETVRRLVAGEAVDLTATGMSKREINEFCSIVGLPVPAGDATKAGA